MYLLFRKQGEENDKYYSLDIEKNFFKQKLWFFFSPLNYVPL